MFSEKLVQQAKKYFEVKFKAPISDEQVEVYLDLLGELILVFSSPLKEMRNFPPSEGNSSQSSSLT